jgi:hypothetical protein
MLVFRMKSTLQYPTKITIVRIRSQKQIFIFRFFEEHAPNGFATTRCTPDLDSTGTFENLFIETMPHPRKYEFRIKKSIGYRFSKPPTIPAQLLSLERKSCCTAQTSEFLVSHVPFSNCLYCPSLSFENFPLFCIFLVCTAMFTQDCYLEKFRWGFPHVPHFTIFLKMDIFVEQQPLQNTH